MYEEGFKDKELRNKVPYVFAFCYEEEENYEKLDKEIVKYDCTFVEHCFPRGEVNLKGIGGVAVSKELREYFISEQCTSTN